MSEKRLSSISKQSKPSMKPAKKMPVKMVVRDIANFKGISKSAAVLEYVNEQRAKPKLDYLNEKMNTPKTDMPWSPELRNLVRCPIGAVSTLNRDDHRRYVAIISNFLQPTPSFRFELNRIELEGWDQRLQPERDQFEQCIQAHISHSKFSPFNTVISGAASLFAHRQREKLLDAFGGLAFWNRVTRVAWPTAADEEIPSATFRLRCMETLGAGRIERVRFHDVRRRCQYFMNDRAIDEHFTAEAIGKTKLVDDPVALDWSLRSGLEYVMDASTLRQMLVDGWAFRNQTFCYRLSVIRRVREGTTHRVCFFSKPLLASRIDQLHVHRQFMKWTVKAEIRRTAQRIAATKPTAAVRSSARPAPVVEETTTTTTMMDADDGGPKVGNDLLGGILGSMGGTTSVVAGTPKMKTEPFATVAGSSGTTIGVSNDLLGGILGSMNANPSSVDGSQIKTESSFSFDNLLNITAASSTSSTITELPPSGQRRYRYETVSLTAADSGTLIVRTSNHGVDPEGKSISVTVRNEYVPEAGAQVTAECSTCKCDEERLWNCVTATLKDAAEHLSMHMYPRNGHCLQVQRYHAARHFSDMDIRLKKMLWTRIRRVVELLRELDKLDIGEYVIMQNGESLNILQEHDGSATTSAKAEPTDEDWAMETESPTPSVVSAETLLATLAVDEAPTVVPSGVGPWNGVDPHLPLVWQIVHGRIPGSLLPPEHKLHKMVTALSDVSTKAGSGVGKKGPNLAGQKISKSKKRKMRREMVQNGVKLPYTASSSSNALSQKAQVDKIKLAVKPTINDTIAGQSAIAAPAVRRFKRPGEKPSGVTPKISTPAGREAVKYDETPF